MKTKKLSPAAQHVKDIREGFVDGYKSPQKKKLTDELFLTVCTRTKAGVEREVFTFASSITEAEKKVEAHFKRKHDELLEKYSYDEELVEYFGPTPPVKVTAVYWKDQFIP